MKKILSVLACIAMVFVGAVTLSACGSGTTVEAEITSEEIVAKQSNFVSNYQGKTASAGYVTLDDDSDYYFIIENVELTAEIESVTFAGQTLASGNVEFALSDSESIAEPLYKYEDSKFYIAFPLVSLTQPTNGKLVFEIKQTDNSKCTLKISMPEMSDLSAELVTLGGDEVIETNGVYTSYVDDNGKTLVVRFALDNETITYRNTVYIVKQVVEDSTGTHVSYALNDAIFSGTRTGYWYTGVQVSEDTTMNFSISTSDAYAIFDLSLNLIIQ